MSSWEKFIHVDQSDRLVQVAILHTEFESLHPFLDGNGRLERMLIPLLMWQHKLMSSPMLYISAYFESQKKHTRRIESQKTTNVGLKQKNDLVHYNFANGLFVTSFCFYLFVLFIILFLHSRLSVY